MAGTGIPSSCWAEATYLQDDGTFSFMSLAQSRMSYSFPTSERGRLGCTPIASVVRTTAETRAGIRLDGYAVSRSGSVQHVVRDWADDSSMRTTRRTVVRGWSGARALAAGSGYVYAVVDDRLRRYRVSSTGSLTRARR